MAGKVNFSVIKGDTFRRTCTIKSPTGTAINLTGASISGKAGTVDVKVDLTCTITSAVNGEFKIELSALQTASFQSEINTIEVQITYADSTVSTILSGNLIATEQFA